MCIKREWGKQSAACFGNRESGEIMLEAERDMTLAIPFNKELGVCCPKCLAIGIGTQLKEQMHYCPYCGQKVKLVATGRDWNELVKDCMKIPDVMDSKIVTTGVTIPGSGKPDRYIDGVYLQRLKDYNNKHAQIEGQLSLF